MSLHRCINIALAVLILVLMAYVGPRLDESACLLGTCAFIDLDETADDIKMMDIVVLWGALVFMFLCTLAVICGAVGYFAYWMGWL
jgi:uncharacterized paraquat-inducible protein A